VALSTGSKVFLVVLLLVFGGIGGGLWYVNQILEGSGDGEPVTITVEQGATMQSIGDDLYAEGVIGNTTAFRLLARDSEAASNIQPGEYEFRTGMAIADAIAVIEAGPSSTTVRDELTFGVAEGLSVPLTLDAIAADLATVSDEPSAEPSESASPAASPSATGTETPLPSETAIEEPTLTAEQQAFRDDLVAVLDAHLAGDGPLTLPEWLPDPSGLEITGPHPYVAFEGVLFPQTWRVFADDSSLPQVALQKMVDELARSMDSIPDERIAAMEEAGIDRYRAMIIASLIERETRVDAERAQVASVIYNRLERDMPLQIDATVLFALGKWKERVLQQDTTVESPWNTYQNPGLPPTPISGFGIASLSAAFSPEETDYLYYVVAPECDGTHRFATSLEEHNRNVQAFRDAGGCGQS
jgi:UPF0755 protein